MAAQVQPENQGRSPGPLLPDDRLIRLFNNQSTLHHSTSEVIMPPFDKRRSVDDILRGASGSIEAWWDKVEAASDDFEPLPAGQYNCLISGGSVNESATGKPSYSIEFTVIDGPHINRKLWLRAGSPARLPHWRSVISRRSA